ncbi:hypothetical protein QVD17_26655 [Tagetes erecta]|uniref:Uncharacterized protein n=1 Tax=Tagetes erecta TaxID=13708 RepID=A0AAD8NR11_TARER|nr:hypothetical protein QVD17_26655 [Tagetes erecta]
MSDYSSLGKETNDLTSCNDNAMKNKNKNTRLHPKHCPRDVSSSPKSKTQGTKGLLIKRDTHLLVLGMVVDDPGELVLSVRLKLRYSSCLGFALEIGDCSNFPLR